MFLEDDDGRIHDSTKELLMVYLTADDKIAIAALGPTEHVYAPYPEGRHTDAFVQKKMEDFAYRAEDPKLH